MLTYSASCSNKKVFQDITEIQGPVTSSCTAQHQAFHIQLFDWSFHRLLQDTLSDYVCDSAGSLVSSIATIISNDSCIYKSCNTYCMDDGLNSVSHLRHVFLLEWTTAHRSWGVTHLMPIDKLPEFLRPDWQKCPCDRFSDTNS